MFGFALLTGCGDEGPIAPAEMEVLRSFAIVAPPPIDRSNRLSDPSHPLAAAAQQLGKKLYFDPEVSGALGRDNDGVANGSLGATGDAGRVSCASCHDLENGGSDRRSLPSATSLGAGYTTRNSATVINAAYSPVWQFWDGRRDSLWSQALSPIEGATEANGSRLRVAHLIRSRYADEYGAIFSSLPDLSDWIRFPGDGKPGDAAFDALGADDQRSINTIFANFGKAIAAYESLLVSTAFEPSSFDKFITGDLAALSPGAIRGARLFIGKAGCRECHRGPMLTDFEFHNVGVPQQGAEVPVADLGRQSGLALLRADPFNRGGEFTDMAAPEDPEATLLAEEETTDALYMGRFKTPSLRNVAKTAPYMHDGVYKNLWDVVNHYNFGGMTGGYVGDRDPALLPLLLTQAEMGDLVEFLEALSDGPPLDPTLIRP